MLDYEAWLDRWHAKRLALWILISLLGGFVGGVWVDHAYRGQVISREK